MTDGWVASYDDPIRVSRGDALSAPQKEDIWDGHRWLWVEANGRAGWVPDTLFQNGTAAFAYSAQELTCAKGERLIRTQQTHGWSWCENSQGQHGWVPDRHLYDLGTSSAG